MHFFLEPLPLAHRAQRPVRSPPPRCSEAPGAGGNAEVVEGLTTGLTATTVERVTGPKDGQFTLTVKDIVANDPTYKWQVGEILRGNTSGAQADIISVEYTTYVRNEDE